MNLTVVSLVVAVVACLTAAYCLWQMLLLNRLKKSFFSGKNAQNLESVIYSLGQRLEISERQQETLLNTLKELRVDTNLAIQKIGLVRFNPFEGSGGNFSFCLALLNAYDSGVVITSMYGREQNRIYTKKLTEGKCENPLNEEEQQAVREANGKS